LSNLATIAPGLRTISQESPCRELKSYHYSCLQILSLLQKGRIFIPFSILEIASVELLGVAPLEAHELDKELVMI